MWNTPSREQLDLIPRLYETENVPAGDKLIYLHFFIGKCDWFIAEYDGDDLFFGFAILNSDYEMAEWGYISFAELKSISIHCLEIDCETNWTLKKASEIGEAGERSKKGVREADIILAFFWLLLFTVALGFINFIPVISVFILLSTKLYGKQSWVRSIAMATTIGAFIYVVFKVLLQTTI